MATFTVQDVIEIVQRRLYDANDSYRRWADDYYIDGANAAVTAITAARPDSVSNTVLLRTAPDKNEYFVPGYDDDAAYTPTTGSAYTVYPAITNTAAAMTETAATALPGTAYPQAPAGAVVSVTYKDSGNDNTVTTIVLKKLPGGTWATFTVDKSTIELSSNGLPTGQAFVRVVRHISAGKAGSALREAPLDQMDASHPDWALDVAKPTHFIRSPDTKRFFLYPTPDSDYTVSVVYTREPNLVSGNTDAIDLPGQYLAAVCSYVAYYILRMETTDESAFAKADAYYKEYLHNAGFEITQGGTKAQQDAQAHIIGR